MLKAKLRGKPKQLLVGARKVSSLNALLIASCLVVFGISVVKLSHASQSYPRKVYLVVNGGAVNVPLYTTNHDLGDCYGRNGSFYTQGNTLYCSGNTIGNSYDDAVFVYAQPVPGYTFTNWQSGDQSGCNGGNPCRIYMPADGTNTIVANYAPNSPAPPPPPPPSSNPASLTISLANIPYGVNANFYSPDHGIADCAAGANVQFTVTAPYRTCTGPKIGPGTPEGLHIVAPAIPGYSFSGWSAYAPSGAGAVVQCSTPNPAGCYVDLPAGTSASVFANYIKNSVAPPPPPPPPPPTSSSASLTISLANIPTGMTVPGFYSPDHGIADCAAGANSQFSITAPYRTCTGPKIGPGTPEGLHVVAPAIAGYTFTGWSANAPTGAGAVVQCSTPNPAGCYVDLPAGTTASVFANYAKSSGSPAPPPPPGYLPPPPPPPGSPTPPPPPLAASAGSASLTISLANIPIGMTAPGFYSPDHGIGNCAAGANNLFSVTAPYRTCTASKIGPGSPEGLHIVAPDIPGYTFTGWSANAPTGAGAVVQCATPNPAACYVDLPAGTSASVFANYEKGSGQAKIASSCSGLSGADKQTCLQSQSGTQTTGGPPPPGNATLTISLANIPRDTVAHGFFSLDHGIGNCTTGSYTKFDVTAPFRACTGTKIGPGNPEGLHIVAASIPGYAFTGWTATPPRGSGAVVDCNTTSPGGCYVDLPPGTSGSVFANYTKDAPPPSGTYTPSGSMKQLAQQVQAYAAQTPAKVTYDLGPSSGTAGAIADLANGLPPRTTLPDNTDSHVSNCSPPTVDPILLWIVLAIAHGGHTVDISALTTRHACGDNNPHILGYAIDLNRYDSQPITGRNAPAIAVINTAIPFLPAGSGFGQIYCGSADIPTRFRQLDDTCDHLHIETLPLTPAQTGNVRVASVNYASSTGSGCSNTYDGRWNSPLPLHYCAETYIGNVPVYAGGSVIYDGCYPDRYQIPLQPGSPSTCAKAVRDPMYANQ